MAPSRFRLSPPLCIAPRADLATGRLVRPPTRCFTKTAPKSDVRRKRPNLPERLSSSSGSHFGPRGLVSSASVANRTGATGRVMLLYESLYEYRVSLIRTDAPSRLAPHRLSTIGRTPLTSDYEQV